MLQSTTARVRGAETARAFIENIDYNLRREFVSNTAMELWLLTLTTHWRPYWLTWSLNATLESSQTVPQSIPQLHGREVKSKVFITPMMLLKNYNGAFKTDRTSMTKCHLKSLLFRCDNISEVSMYPWPFISFHVFLWALYLYHTSWNQMSEDVSYLRKTAANFLTDIWLGPKEFPVLYHRRKIL